MPTVNYLAVFPSGELKTGVALEERKHSRILEQGALYAGFFTSIDGMTARYIEENISQNLSIAQSLSWKRKLEQIKHVPTQDEASRLLLEKIELYKQKSTYRDNIQKVEIYNAMNVFKFPFTNLSNDLYYIQKVSYGDELSGKYLGLYGTILFFVNKSKIYAVDVRSFLGYTLLPQEGSQITVSGESIRKIMFERTQSFL